MDKYHVQKNKVWETKETYSECIASFEDIRDSEQYTDALNLGERIRTILMSKNKNKKEKEE